MYLRILNYFPVLCLFVYQAGFSQKLDSIQKLDEVTISSPRFRYFNTGNYYITVDSVTKSINQSSYLKNLLSSSSTMQINSYGVGVATLSARGTGESRTPVLWNGFNLQSITSAGVDVAQVPSLFFENVNIQSGGGTALFGSGAVGGIVHLSNGVEFNQPLKMDLGSFYGSFGNFVENVKLSYGNSKYAASVKVFFNKAKNNFPFSGSYQTESKLYSVSGRQVNSQAKQYGFMLNNYLRVSTNQALNFHLWFQDADINIAPTLSDLAYNSVVPAAQFDRIMRGSAEYSVQKGNISVWGRSGLFYNKLNYDHPYFGSSGKGFSSVSEIESSYSPINLLKINGGLNYTYERATSSTYPGLEVRNRMALFSSIKAGDEYSQASFNVRGEAINGEFVPVTFSVGIQQSYFENFCVLQLNASKNYRLPSFNDMYFKDYYSEGNPGLKPEKGMNYEGGLTFQKKNNLVQWKLRSSYFHSDMSNWINWAMRPDSIWTVYNIDEAQMDGLENTFELTRIFHKLSITFKGMYTYTNAKNKNTLNQLPYMPKNKILGSFTILYNSFTVQFQQIFNSEMFADVSNLNTISAHWLSNVFFSYAVPLPNFKLKANFQVNNLLNKNYMSMATYPMPGRNFMAGLSITL